MKQLEDYWPVGRWRTSTPEEQGMDSELLVQACNFARQHGLHIHSLLIIRHGYAVVDAYFHPFLPGTMHDLASCTKSFTATLIGIAVDKGFIKSVKQPVLGFFPNNRVANLTDLKKELTLEHLLTMTSGMACYNEPGEITLREMFQSPDWRQFVLDLPMIEPSGTRFEYCSPGSHLLSAIVRETTGMSTMAFAREYLFGPLGIDAVWPEDPQGINHGWGDLHMTPHDMARLGYLYLHKGQWENRTIVSPQWVSAATKKHSSPPAGPSPIHGYGYQWWLFTPEIYYADGRGGQMIIVVPEADVVAVTTAGLSDDEKQRLDEMLISFIIPSIRSSTPLPVNPDGVAQLESGIRQPILYRDEPERPPVLPPAAQQITGQTYLLESNILGWREFSFIFNELEEALFLPAIGSESYEFRLGLDNVFRLNPEARFGLPAMLKGKWHQPDTFTVYWDEVANINRWQMDFTFEGDSVTIQAQESSWHGGVTVNGKLKK